MVFALTDEITFPDPHYGDPDGLLAVGGDLPPHPGLLQRDIPLVHFSGGNDTMVVPAGTLRHFPRRNPYLPLHADAHKQREVRYHYQSGFR